MGGDVLVFHELFKCFVFQFRVCSVEYFLDTMTEWEINDIIENLPFMDRNLWESSRLNAWVLANMNSKEPLNFQDVIRFKWETETEDSNSIEISNEDIERLREKVKTIRVC